MIAAPVESESPTGIFNTSIMIRSFTEDWKVARVRPPHKGVAKIMISFIVTSTNITYYLKLNQLLGFIIRLPLHSSIG